MLQLISTYPSFRPQGETYENFPTIYADGGEHALVFDGEFKGDVIKNIIFDCLGEEWVDCIELITFSFNYETLTVHPKALGAKTPVDKNILVLECGFEQHLYGLFYTEMKIKTKRVLANCIKTPLKRIEKYATNYAPIKLSTNLLWFDPSNCLKKSLSMWTGTKDLSCRWGKTKTVELKECGLLKSIIFWFSKGDKILPVLNNFELFAMGKKKIPIRSGDARYAHKIDKLMHGLPATDRYTITFNKPYLNISRMDAQLRLNTIDTKCRLNLFLELVHPVQFREGMMHFLTNPNKEFSEQMREAATVNGEIVGGEKK